MLQAHFAWISESVCVAASVSYLQLHLCRQAFQHFFAWLEKEAETQHADAIVLVFHAGKHNNLPFLKEDSAQVDFPLPDNWWWLDTSLLGQWAKRSSAMPNHFGPPMRPFASRMATRGGQLSVQPLLDGAGVHAFFR